MELTAEYPVEISNPNKLFWPEAHISKLDYIHYLIEVAPMLLHHLHNRPLTVIRFPNGIHGTSFFQKDIPSGAPPWVKTTPIWSPDRKDYIHYILVDSIATLIWLGNLAALEFHVGFATVSNLNLPTHVVFDLDPTVAGFDRVREVALSLHEVLNTLALPHAAKTSGATGIQVYIPIESNVHFEETRLFTEAVARYLEIKLPHVVTLERFKRNRSDKVYVDYLQHGPGRTLIAPYSARATVKGTISMPISWSILERGAVPEDFTQKSAPVLIRQQGDLLSTLQPVNLSDILQFLKTNGSSPLQLNL